MGRSWPVAKATQYVAVNADAVSGRSGDLFPFVSREVDGRILPVHASATDANNRALSLLAHFGVLVPKPEGLETTQFHE